MNAGQNIIDFISNSYQTVSNFVMGMSLLSFVILGIFLYLMYRIVVLKGKNECQSQKLKHVRSQRRRYRKFDDEYIDLDCDHDHDQEIELDLGAE